MGMRNAERKKRRQRSEVFECGIGNAECGKKKEDRGQRQLNAELGMRNAEVGMRIHSISDLGFGISDSNDKEWKRNAAQMIDQVFSVYRLTQST